jgi:hypothetical protein
MALGSASAGDHAELDVSTWALRERECVCVCARVCVCVCVRACVRVCVYVHE